CLFHVWTQSVECSKLGKTRIIADASIRRVRNATFFEQNFHLHFQLKSPSVPLVIFLIASRQTGYSRCDSPFFCLYARRCSLMVSRTE
ncbi:MAG TPA: hypothetical protein DF667_00450, partial [Roseburia sp.]|nr:hypothetical protein [Roseburia sp.]